MGKIVVNITRGATPPAREAFGTALLLANSAHDYKEYANLVAVGVDFATTTTVYKMASAYFGQEQTPTKLSIAGVSYTESVAVVNETLTLVSGNTYSFDNAQVVVNSIANLEDNAVPIPDSDIVEIDYVAGTIEFATSKTTVTCDYSYYNDPVALTNLLSQLVLESRDFYGIMLEASGYRVQKAVNDWVNGQRYLPIYRTNILPDVYPVTLDESIQPYYHTTADEYPDAAVFGKCLPQDPGALTWNFQTLIGLTANQLTAAQETTLTSGRFNSVTLQYGSIATFNGFYGTDLFIDQKRSEDYVEVNMQNNIGAMLITNPKVPYDDRGISQVVSVVEKTLNQAFTQGIIAAKGDGKTADFAVTSQSRAEIAQNDPSAITSRVLRSVTFQYVEANAIEGATVNGEIVLQL